MTFFYDLNKRMADLATKQDAQQLAEDSVTAPRSKSQLTESLKMAEADYSAKKAAAGKDIGKPGKMFSKIAKNAGAKYGSKAAGERVAGAVLNKLRAKESVDEADMEEGNEFSGELVKARAQGAKEFNVDGKSYPVKETEMTPKQKSFAKLAPPVDKITFADKIAGAKQEVDEMLGDVAAEAMKAAVGKMREADNPGLEEDEMAEGFKEMNAWLKSREAEKGTGKFDSRKVSTGTVYTRKPETFASDDEETSDAPRGRGRPKGKDKGPERVTAKSYKYKSGRPAKAMEGDMDPADSGEYDREGDMAKEQMHTIMSAAKELHGILKDEENLPEWVQKKITLAKEYIDTARDYMLSQHAERAEEEPIAEKAVSKKQQKFMGMVHAAQKGKKPASGEVAKVAKTMKKSDATDFAATKHKGLPEKVKAKKEEKVEEIAVGGGNKSSESPNHKISGMEVGKGVYEGLNRQFAQALTEGMNISVNMSTGDDGQPTKSINISADGDDANKLAELLKMAGLDSSAYEQAPCSQCGSSSCGCAEVVDENKPDWPTNVETSDDALQYSGGLNKPKSTGQTTIPVIASQLRRQVSMEEGVKLERSLFKLYKDFTSK